MKISLKNKPLAYFSNNPGVVVSAMFIIIVSLVITGASQKKVTLIDGMSRREIMTYKGTVRDVLEQNNIQLNSKDKIYPSMESVVRDGSDILVRRAVPVTVIVDGKEMQLLSAEETVEDMLTAEKLTYGEKDKILPGTDTAVTKDMEIRVVRVTEKEIEEKQVLLCSREIKEMPEWEKGVEKTLRNGNDGEKLTKIKITYEDGVEKKREVVDEQVTKEPVSRLIAVGTLDWRTVSRGEVIKFSRMIVMRATHYTDNIACTGKEGGHTATGTVPRRMEDGSRWSTVAVDPHVIPLGTKLWIEGYGFAIAEDVGGGVKGNEVDLFVEDFRNQKRGSLYRRVYILK
jgi:uncharacterized protein YabE (DUF348 family)